MNHAAKRERGSHGADVRDLLQQRRRDGDTRRHGDTAIANYRFVAKFTGPKVDVHRRYRTTNVWIKRDGRWQIVTAHTAFLPEGKGVDLSWLGSQCVGALRINGPAHLVLGFMHFCAISRRRRAEA
jgi:hypothetical protein